jgi:predicted branched-subunit amino acid permease
MRSSNVHTLSLSVGIATGLYGISFGALAVASGLDIWQTCFLSLFMFSGGSQFAFIGVLGSGGLLSLPAAVLSAWLLGVRNGFYAVNMSALLGSLGLKRPIAAQLAIDESAAVALSREGDEQSKGFWLTGSYVFIFWNLLTLVGALLGSSIGDPKVWGLDAAAAAAFVALVWPRLRGSRMRLTGFLSVLVAVVSSPYIPVGVPILLAGAVAVLVWLLPERAKA